MQENFVPGTWRRLTAYGIDQMLCLLFYFPFFSYIVRLLFSEEAVMLSLTQLLVMFLIPAVYDFVFLVLMQGSPGKWFMGLKVIPKYHPEEKLEFGACLLRAIVQRMQFFFGWAIYAVAFFNLERTHLADWIAETRVVQATERPTKPRVRWVLGLIFILAYVYEGLSSSSYVLGKIDWHNRQVNLRDLIATDTLKDFDFGQENDFDL